MASGAGRSHLLAWASRLQSAAVDGISKRAYLWDPRLVAGRGIDGAWVAAIRAALAAIVPAITVHVWAVDLQPDSHQCGVWAIVYTAMWLVWLRTVGSGCFHTWLEQRVRDDGAAPPGTASTQAFISRLRRTAAALHSAAVAQPGAVAATARSPTVLHGAGTASQPACRT
jgi:hypothetical protein